MTRYFISVLYKGTQYAGFQIQDNANSIQFEVEKALRIFFKISVQLTCSSRTDAGVHALSNYFHFDSDAMPGEEIVARSLYNLNAILPQDIVVKAIFPVPDHWHSRFTASAREYWYYLYQAKDPFLSDRAFYYPYKLDLAALNHAAALLREYTDFTSFSKRNTQVKTFNCSIEKSEWVEANGMIIYQVKANRFLRGMVRGLVGTMLRVGSHKISLEEFSKIIESKNCSKADFSVPPQGLFLINVFYPGL